MNGIFSVVALMEIAWAVTLQYTQDAYGTIPLFYLGEFVGGIAVVPICLISAAFLTLFSLLYKNNHTKQAFLITPQQMFISIIALGAMVSTMSGTYADGVIRSKLFIFADQLPVMAVFCMHSIAYIRKFIFRNGN